MWPAIRLVLAALAVYIVVTASDEQKTAMLTGARAFASAAEDACTRNTLCNDAVDRARAAVHATSQRMRQSSIDRGPALLER